jgi:hypothetical protein
MSACNSFARRIVLSSPTPSACCPRASSSALGTFRSALSIQGAFATSAAPGRPAPITATSLYTSEEMTNLGNSLCLCRSSKHPSLARITSGDESETAITFLKWPVTGSLHSNLPACIEGEEHRGAPQNPEMLPTAFRKAPPPVPVRPCPRGKAPVRATVQSPATGHQPQIWRLPEALKAGPISPSS